MKSLLTRVWTRHRPLAIWLFNPWRLVRELREEKERLLKTLADPFAMGVQMGNGTLDVHMEAPAAQVMAGMYLGMFEKSPPDNKNYIQATFSSPVGDIVVTVQHPRGKTPHQLLREAQEEIAAIKARRSDSARRAAHTRGLNKRGPV